MAGGWNVSHHTPRIADVSAVLRKEHLPNRRLADELARQHAKEDLRDRLISTLEEKVRALEREAHTRSHSQGSNTHTHTHLPSPRKDTTRTSPRKAHRLSSPRPSTAVPPLSEPFDYPVRGVAIRSLTPPASTTPRSKLARRRRRSAEDKEKETEKEKEENDGAEGALEEVLVKRHGSLRAAYANLQAIHSPRLTAAKRFYAASGEGEHSVLPPFLDAAALSDYASFRRAVRSFTGNAEAPEEDHLRHLQAERSRIARLLHTRETHHKLQLEDLRREVSREQGEHTALLSALSQLPRVDVI